MQKSFRVEGHKTVLTLPGGDVEVGGGGVFLLRSVRVCLALTQFFYNKMYSCIVYIILKDTSVLKRTVASVGKDVA